MSKRKKSSAQNSSPRPSVVQEAWGNMMRDFDRVLPKSFHGKQGKKKFVLWLFIVEILVLGVVFKFAYDWLTS